jgi:hypothetical protein
MKSKTLIVIAAALAAVIVGLLALMPRGGGQPVQDAGAPVATVGDAGAAGATQIAPEAVAGEESAPVADTDAASGVVEQGVTTDPVAPSVPADSFTVPAVDLDLPDDSKPAEEKPADAGAVTQQ